MSPNHGEKNTKDKNLDFRPHFNLLQCQHSNYVQIFAEHVTEARAYGYIKDYPLERHFRDAKVFTIYPPTEETYRTLL